jgi:hypothetical protein
MHQFITISFIFLLILIAIVDNKHNRMDKSHIACLLAGAAVASAYFVLKSTITKA